MSGEFTLDLAAERMILKITRINGKPVNKLRMLQMGITPGTRVQVLRHAPLADPVEIVVRGTKLALRRDEAKDIAVIEAD